MAVVIEAFTVVIRNGTLEARFPGGVAGYRDNCPNRTFCTDGSIARVAFMTFTDVQTHLMKLLLHGLTYQEDHPDTTDIALIDQDEGLLSPCGWLQLGESEGVCFAWLSETEVGPVAAPASWAPGKMNRRRAPAELVDYEFVRTGETVAEFRNRVTGESIYLGASSHAIIGLADLTEPQKAEHDRVYKQAVEIAWDELPFHQNGDQPWLDASLRRELEHALALLERAIELNPGNWSAMFFIGMLHRRLGDPAKALESLERAARVNHSSADIPREATLCALLLQQWERAVALALQAVKIEPANWGLHGNLALAYLYSGRIAEASEAIRIAIQRDPSDKLLQEISDTIKALETHDS